MEYELEFRPASIRDLGALSPDVAQRIVDKIAALRTIWPVTSNV